MMDAANLTEIPANRKKTYFLSFCGAAVFNTATALLAPQTVKAMTCKELQEVLSNHYMLKSSRIACQYAFRRRTQAEGETISEYMIALRSAAFHCGFQDLDDMLLDQLVCGVRDLRLQRHLLAKADLNLKAAIEEAQAVKISTLSVAQIQSSSSYLSRRTNIPIHY
ncbi:hypothetical protein E2320_001799 [Naja naja]|nr:hypothetical protein E2320_001799 [Naja naja]